MDKVKRIEIYPKPAWYWMYYAWKKGKREGA